MSLELQPVILAGGEGSRLYPLTEALPKCLLPIGNYPMIWYVITYLERSGFYDFILIVRRSEEQQITSALHALFLGKLNFFLHSVSDDEDIGTAVALASVRDKIKKDVLLISCDTATDVSLHRLLDIHRTYNSSLTALFTPAAPVNLSVDTEQPLKGAKVKLNDPYAGQKDFVAVDGLEKRLLFLANEADMEDDSIRMRHSLLERYPKVHLQTDLVDAHLYIMKKWIIDYLCKSNAFESVKSDLIPHIIRKQFSKPKSSSASGVDIFDFATSDEISTLTKNWSGYMQNNSDNSIRCHALVADGLCLRVNNLVAYGHINRQITKLLDALAPGVEISRVHSKVSVQEKSQIGPDSLVGESTTIGELSSVKKSVIGNHCSIGSKVKIGNCVIMNHVTIKDGCNIQNSIICDNAEIKENCQIASCQVAARQTIPENSELKNETIIHEEMDFD